MPIVIGDGITEMTPRPLQEITNRSNLIIKNMKSPEGLFHI